MKTWQDHLREAYRDTEISGKSGDVTVMQTILLAKILAELDRLNTK